MAIRLVQFGGDAWRESAEPWLRGVEAWRDARPTVVLTPDRAQGFYLRSRMVAEKQAALGVHFWTPSDAREFLRGSLCPHLRAATQNDQALIARACAEKLLRGKAGDDEATLRSVAQDPEPFRRAYDLLQGAGWNPEKEGVAYGRRLAREFQATLAKAGLTTQAELHRKLRDTMPPKKKPIARVLIVNFDAAHWPLWDLLQAVCLMADEAKVALEHPGEFGKQLDELWTGSWESFAKTVYQPGEHEGSEPGPLTALAASYEAGLPTPCPKAEVHFLATTGLGEQIRAVTLQILEYLRRSDCVRLGVVFPQGDALALGVAEQLRALKIPMNDTLGALRPGPCESRWWRTWLELQEEATVRRLIAWLCACDALQIETGLGAVTAEDAVTPARILIVDDEPAVLNLVKTILSRARHEVTTCGGGHAALKLLSEGFFDCVITDAVMPMVSGFDLVRAIRRNPAHADLPILMLTRKRQPQDIKKAVEAGVSDYILKPIDESLLLDKVEASIKKSSAKRHVFELTLNGPEALAMLNLESEITSISEVDLTMWVPIELSTERSFSFTSRVFDDIGITMPILKLMQCVPTEDGAPGRGPGYLAKFSFMGMQEPDLKKIRAWLQREAIRRRK